MHRRFVSFFVQLFSRLPAEVIYASYTLWTSILDLSFFVLVVNLRRRKSLIKVLPLHSRCNIMFFLFPDFEGNALWNVPVYTSHSIGTNFYVTNERKLYSAYLAYCWGILFRRPRYFLAFPQNKFKVQETKLEPCCLLKTYVDISCSKNWLT